MVAVLPLPDTSGTVLPVPSLKLYAATRPLGGGVWGRGGGVCSARSSAAGTAGPDRRVHVALDLRRGQRAVVDPHLVDHPVEELTEQVVAADLERVGGRDDGAGAAAAGDLDAIDVQPDRRAVVREGEMRPAARGNDGRTVDDHVEPAERSASSRHPALLDDASRKYASLPL